MSNETKRALADHGKVRMTPIQSLTFPVLVSGRNCFAVAKTGEGKTLAFLLPVIERLRANRTWASDSGRLSIGALVMSPVYELAQQIKGEADKYIAYHSWARTALYAKNKNHMSGNVAIAVGTPGTVKAMLQEYAPFKDALSRALILVLDEADALIGQGFRKDLETISASMTRPDRQTIMTSATRPESVVAAEPVFMGNNYELLPKGVSVDRPTLNPNVRQVKIVVNPPEVLHTLAHVLSRFIAKRPSGYRVIVFFPTKVQVELAYRLFNAMPKNEIPQVLRLHGGIDKTKRTQISNAFRAGQANVMFTTDASARGLDYPDALVVQTGISDTEPFIHRSGRTARGKDASGVEKTGENWTIWTPLEERAMSVALAETGITFSDADLGNDNVIKGAHVPEYPALAQAVRVLKMSSEKLKVGDDRPMSFQQLVQTTFNSIIGFMVSKRRSHGFTSAELVADARAYLSGLTTHELNISPTNQENLAKKP